MLRRHADMGRIENHEMRGGTGTIHMTQILKPDELMGKGRLFNHITINPGCSIGKHQHTGEAEIFYILSGRAVADDDGAEVVLEPGDMLYTGDGCCHSIRCDGDTPLEMVALILFS